MQQQYNIVKDLLTPADHPTNVFTKTRVAFRGNMEEMCTYINKTTVLKSFLYSIIKSCFTVSSMLTFSLSYLHKKQLAFMSFARQLYVYDFLKRKSTILFKKKMMQLNISKEATSCQSTRRINRQCPVVNQHCRFLTQVVDAICLSRGYHKHFSTIVD